MPLNNFLMFYFSFDILEIKRIDNIDTCLDVGICTQGLEINTEYGLVRINQKIA